MFFIYFIYICLFITFIDAMHEIMLYLADGEWDDYLGEFTLLDHAVSFIFGILLIAHARALIAKK